VFSRSRSETQIHGARISTAAIPGREAKRRYTGHASRLQLSRSRSETQIHRARISVPVIPVAKRNADTQGRHLAANFLFLNRSSPRFLLFFYRLPKTKSPCEDRHTQEPPASRITNSAHLFIGYHIFFRYATIFLCPITFFFIFCKKRFCLGGRS
jgi:hypothetical protein